MHKVLINFVFFRKKSSTWTFFFNDDFFRPEITYAVWACEQNENTYYKFNFNYFKHEGVAVCCAVCCAVLYYIHCMYIKGLVSVLLLISNMSASNV